MIDNGLMNESTSQFVIKVFAICMAVAFAAIIVTYCIIVLRDGNDPLVAQAFSNLTNIAGQAFVAISAIIIGKPIASGVLQFLAGKGVQASTTNVPVAPNGTPVGSSQSATVPQQTGA